MRRFVVIILVVAAIAAAAGWILTAPKTVSGADYVDIQPDLERGELVFYAAGCASCHSAPEAVGDDKLVLAGGRSFASDFGTFYAPNISPDPENGIGDWSVTDLANALIHGTGPRGQHYYPALPYTSYNRMTPEDLVSLHTFLATLPVDVTPSQDHDVGFPFNIRRALGGWKLLYANSDWVVDGDLTEQQLRGRYLVEALGHCGECHTPRDALGGLEYDRWLAGAPNPNGSGRIPGIAPGVLDWSEGEIAEYLKSGFTPEFDTVGGEMVDVVENTAKLSDEDRAAIAAYVKAVPDQSDGG